MFSMRLLILSVFVVSLVSSTLEPPSKDEKKKKKAKPTLKSVVERDLIKSEPHWTEITKNHKKYSRSHVAQKAFSHDLLGFVTPWNSHGYDVAKVFGAKFNYIVPVWLQIVPTSQGTFTIKGGHDIDAGWMNQVRRNNTNVKIVPRLIFEQWSISHLTKVTTSQSELLHVVQTILDFLSDEKFDGVVLELWRQFMGKEKANLHRLIIAISEGLSEKNMETLLVIPPGFRPFPELFDKFDFERLHPHVHRFIMMTYDHHHATGKPGAIGPMDWALRNVLLLMEHNDNDKHRHKLMLGLNFYGVDFTNRGQAKPIISHEYIQLLKATKPSQLSWHLKASEHSFEYRDEDGMHIVFYPTLKAIQRRIEAATNFRIGLAIWEIGQGQNKFPIITRTEQLMESHVRDVLRTRTWILPPPPSSTLLLTEDEIRALVTPPVPPELKLNSSLQTPGKRRKERSGEERSSPLGSSSPLGGYVERERHRLDNLSLVSSEASHRSDMRSNKMYSSLQRPSTVAARKARNRRPSDTSMLDDVVDGGGMTGGHVARYHEHEQPRFSVNPEVSAAVDNYIRSERRYISDINSLLNNHVENLTYFRCLNVDVVNNLKSSLLRILHFHQRSCSDLELFVTQVISASERDARPPDYYAIVNFMSDNLMDNSNGYRLYISYCGTRAQVIRCLTQMTDDEATRYDKFLEHCNPNADPANSFDAGIAMPIQRLLDYPVLLAEVALRGGVRGPGGLGGKLSRCSDLLNDINTTIENRLAMYQEFIPMYQSNRKLEVLIGPIEDLLSYGPVEEVRAKDLEHYVPEGDSNIFLLIYKKGVAILQRIKVKKKHSFNKLISQGASSGGSGSGTQQKSEYSLKKFYPVSCLQVKDYPSGHIFEIADTITSQRVLLGCKEMEVKGALIKSVADIILDYDKFFSSSMQAKDQI